MGIGDFPLLTMHGEAEVLRGVRVAAQRIRPIQFVLTLAMVAATVFFGAWLDGTVAGDESDRTSRYALIVLSAVLFSLISWYVSEHLFRRKVRQLVEAG